MPFTAFCWPSGGFKAMYPVLATGAPLVTIGVKRALAFVLYLASAFLRNSGGLHPDSFSDLLRFLAFLRLCSRLRFSTHSLLFGALSLEGPLVVAGDETRGGRACPLPTSGSAIHFGTGEDSGVDSRDVKGDWRSRSSPGHSWSPSSRTSCRRLARSNGPASSTVCAPLSNVELGIWGKGISDAFKLMEVTCKLELQELLSVRGLQRQAIP